MRNLLLASAAVAALYTNPLLAADKAAEDMKAIEDTFLWFLPEDMHDTVVIEPSGDGYLLEFDLESMFNRAFGTLMEIRHATPASQIVTPLNNGLWTFEGDQPLEFSLTSKQPENVADIVYKIAQMKFEGVFDPAIGYFRDMTMQMSDLQMVMDDGKTNAAISVAEGAFNFGATGTDSSSVDIAGSGEANDIHEVVLDPKNGRVTVDMDRMDVDISVNDLNIGAVRAFAVFLMGRDSKAALDFDEREKLIAIAKEAMPILGSLKEEISISDFSMLAEGMAFKADKVGYGFNFDGLSNNASFEANVNYSGLKLPQDVLPPGTEGAVPQEISMDFALEELQLGDAANYFFEHADTRARELLTENQQAALVDILLPDGRLKLGFHDIVAKSEVYDLTADGAFNVYPGQKDRIEAHFVVHARDFDETVSFLQNNAQRVPQFGQAAFFALMVKGFAFTEDDGSLTWDVEVTEDRMLKINGQELPYLQ